MTDYEMLLHGSLMKSIGGMTLQNAIYHLLREGMLNRRACERLAIRDEVARMAREGIPRCEALHVAADTCCCSYEKARLLFYDKKT